MIKDCIFTVVMWIFVKMRIADESHVSVRNGVIVKAYSSRTKGKGLYN